MTFEVRRCADAGEVGRAVLVIGQYLGAESGSDVVERFVRLMPPERMHAAWDGDTLVVDVTGFNDQSWFDRAGNFHSEALHVVERFTPVDANVLNYEVTIEDPKVFTRPWKIQLPLYRRQERNAQLLEFKCVEFVEELMYGDLVKKTGKEKPYGAARVRWP